MELNACIALLDIHFSVLPCTSGPMGMESGAIPDGSITASTSLNSAYLPQKARLNVGRSDVNDCFDRSVK